MKLRDIVNQIEIDPRKLTDYALNLNSPKGKNKAVLFQKRFGFTRDNYELLLEQITTQALEAEVTVGQADEYGQRYRLDLEIIGMEGQHGMVRTGWIVETFSNTARLTTVYVVRKRR